jgi:phosphatidylglycerophosphatase A
VSTAGSRPSKKAPLDRNFLLAAPAHVVALSGGLGLAPVAPGTFGALAGLPLGLALAWCGPLVAALVLAAGGLLGIWACGVTARAAGVHDHQAIVFDETWAMAAVLAFAPAGLAMAGLGFLAFRFFDIAKPWPIRQIDDRVSGGLGIMLDDALAALFALAVLHVVRWMGLA